MVYRAIGVMSGSSLDGLDIAFASFEENRGSWAYELIAAKTYEYSEEWQRRLSQATTLPAYDYLKLHADYGRYVGEQINLFIQAFNLYHQVQIIASHGHTVFHAPTNGFSAQLGDGATIAAVTGINVISDLRAMDVALGGQGAPIVPVGDKLLFGGYGAWLNLGGIANITCKKEDDYIAFDVCPANKVLNLLAAKEGRAYDENGAMASQGTVHDGLLEHLNLYDYYSKPYPKSLDNGFGIETLLPVIESYGNTNTSDALRTYTEHIVWQISRALQQLNEPFALPDKNLLVTGGGALNTFLVSRLQEEVKPLGYSVLLPDRNVIHFKEALIMALLGLLRWREQNTVLNSVTGASRSSIGGAVWIGQDA